MSNIGMLLGPPVCGAVIENFHSWKAGSIPVAAAMTIGTMLLLPEKANT